MRILIVHNQYRSSQPSGENVVVAREIALLQRAGHEVLTYLKDSDEIASFSRLRKAQLAARIAWSSADGHAIGDVLDHTRPDVVHVHNTFPLISPSVVWEAHRRRVPVVATLHNYRLFCANGLLLRGGRPCETCVTGSSMWGLARGCYRGSRVASAPIAVAGAIHRTLGTWVKGVDVFIALSEFARSRFVAGGLPEEKVWVKPNFAEDDGSHRAGGDAVLFVGRLSEEKGPDLFVDAWEPSFGPGVVVGDGPMRAALVERARAQGKAIEFTGQLPRAVLRERMRHARVLVAPSRAYENLPSTVVEAYSLGLPVVAPRIGAFPEAVEDGISGFLFEAGSSASLRERLALTQDGAIVDALGRGARRLYEERYTPERNLDRLMELYAVARARRAA